MVGFRIGRRKLLQTGAAGITAAYAGCFGPEKDGVYALSLADGSERWVNNLGWVEAGPIVADETVFVGSGQTVYALSTADGTERWSYDVDFEYTSNINDPIIRNEMVLVPAGKELYALSVADGSEQWTFAGDAEIWLAPRPAEGVVVVGSGKTHLYGISVEDGSERWTYEGEALVKNAATVVDATAYIGSRADRAIAIDVASGTERWTFGTDNPVRGGMTVHKGLVYASTTGRRVYALGGESGNEQWRWDVPPGSTIMPVGASWPSTMGFGQSVYIGYAGRLFALMARDGTEQWRANTDLTSMFLQHSGDSIYVSGDGLSDGSGNANAGAGAASYLGLKAFNRRDGRERWSNPLNGGHGEHPPIVGERAVYTGTDEGVIHAIQKSDGSELWTFESGADEIFGPAVGENTIYIGTQR